eukprot:gnl/Trimastix_PCT/2994.p1 GENE.gnl/Trimastix_PCT/2994~~gnl/Trimastix_PCT/2994.p1  ORF type:complete len:965 (-),score=370.01 gnl/Trimastix_PCT/2994:274-3168(-)
MAFATSEDIMEAIISKNVANKFKAIKQVIQLHSSGDRMTATRMLMPIIKHCVNINDPRLKRLLLLFWETIGLTGSDGALRGEFIMICNSLVNDLQSHNEYLQGVTLRFLSKVKEREILVQVLPTVMENLSNPTAYPRRQAILCVHNIYKQFPDLMPDAPETISGLLFVEHDVLAQRNALAMLFNCAPEKALSFLTASADVVHTFGHPVQMVIVALVRRQIRAKPAEKVQWLKCILKLVSSNSAAVKYECAQALLALSSGPIAVKAAAQCYTDVLTSSDSDNNIKAVVLDRLFDMQRKHRRTMETCLSEILSVFASESSSGEIRRKALKMALQLISPRNAAELIGLLRGETTKLFEYATKVPCPKLQTGYASVSPTIINGVIPEQKEWFRRAHDRQVVLVALYKLATQYSEVAVDALHIIFQFFRDPLVQNTCMTANFIKDLVHRYPSMAELVMTKLMPLVVEGGRKEVMQYVMWMLGEYPRDAQTCVSALEAIQQGLGPLPILDTRVHMPGEADQGPTVRILEDGSYSTQPSAGPVPTKKVVWRPEVHDNLRDCIIRGNFFTGCTIANSLARIFIKLRQFDPQLADQHVEGAVDVILAIIAYGESMPKAQPYPDSITNREPEPLVLQATDLERMALCIKVIRGPDPVLERLFTQDFPAAYLKHLGARRFDVLEREFPTVSDEQPREEAPVDKQLAFRAFEAHMEPAEAETEEEEGETIGRSVGKKHPPRVYQLSGFSDPVYVEAVMTVNHYTVNLEFTLINRLADPFHSMNIELTCVRDLQLNDMVIPVPLGANETKKVKTSLKIKSTDTGSVHALLAYRRTPTSSEETLFLDHIHLDVVYCMGPSIHPSHMEYRMMWQQFEWENKIPVRTPITDPYAFVEYIAKQTAARILPYGEPQHRDANYTSACLFASTIFGEDACLHISLEKSPTDGRLSGFCRIRSKHQGIALSLGDKVSFSMMKCRT